MTEIVNLDGYPNSNKIGMYGGAAGNKDGIVYRGVNWMVKYPKTTRDMDNIQMSYTTSPLSEYIGSHIYEILGYDVHETLLGYRNKKIVVACRDFCGEKNNLIEIRTIKNYANGKLAEMLDDSFSSTGEDHFVNLDELMLHLQYNDILTAVPGLIDRFWDMMVIDMFINNNDRNNGNWGILRENGEDRLAPIFDNGASFSNKVDDVRLASFLESPERLEASVLNTTTCYRSDDKVMTVHRMLQQEFPGLQKSLCKNVPLIGEHLEAIKKMIDEIPEEYQGLTVCSKVRKEFYSKSLQMRYEKEFLPAYKRLKKQEE